MRWNDDLEQNGKLWRQTEEQRSPGERAAVATIPLAGSGTTQPPAMGSASFIVDSQGVVLAFDRNMERMTGWNAADVVGRPKNLGLYEPPDENGVRRFNARPLYEGHLSTPTQTSKIRLTINHLDGDKLEVEALTSPLGGSGNRMVVEIQKIIARTHGPTRYSERNETDLLTRLPNASAFHQRLRQTFSDSVRSGRPFGLMLVDIDHFDRINSLHGRNRGDDVLKRVAGILLASVRQSDFVARLEADNFAILLHGAGRGEARHVGGRIRQTIESFLFGPKSDDADGEIRITCSCGVACTPADGDSADELLRRCREALDEAHRLGRNRVWCYVRRPRVPLEMDVCFDGPTRHLLGQSRDLSNSGVFVDTGDLLPLGMRLGLSFSLPGEEEPIRVIGRVARRCNNEAGAPAPYGVGIEFERYEGKDRWRIESFLHQHRTLDADLLRKEPD